MIPSPLFVLATTFLRPTLAASVSSGAFTILSFNVAGLPAILQSNDVPGDKTENTALIGQKFAVHDFDVVHVQEDFNYHATLYANDDHPYRTATSGGAGIGSGLNTLSNFPWAGFAREKWDDCSDASSNDCLTPKGFTLMRVLVDEGVYIDFYNLHADAGSETDDVAARTSNIEQVANFISSNSAGNAVIVFGDTNSRYTRLLDSGIREIVSSAGLTDAWVQLIKANAYPIAGSDALVCDNPSSTTACETVDKVLYRGNSFIDLNATSLEYASSLFLQSDGNILSDHNAVLVNLTYTLASNIRQSNLLGGHHGTWFNDLPSLPSTPTVSSITIRGGNRLDGISLTLTSGTTFAHGGTGGTAYSLTLGEGETWASAVQCQGTYNCRTRIFYIKVTTSTGRTMSTGKTTDDCMTATAPDGFGIVGFFGQSGDEVDELGFIYGY